MTLQEIRKKMETIKSDISKKEGEKTAVMNDLKKEFSVKDLDEAYDQFDSLKKEVEENKKKKDELLISVEGKLVTYGY